MSAKLRRRATVSTDEDNSPPRHNNASMVPRAQLQQENGSILNKIAPDLQSVSRPSELLSLRSQNGNKEDTSPLLTGGDRTIHGADSTSADDELSTTSDEYTPAVASSLSDESTWSIAFQVVFPYLVAGLGMVGAGLALDRVQHWTVFEDVPELFILVPSLLGLKGNLEMTLASRMSTLANLGRIDSAREKWLAISGNLALIEAQAMVVAFLAAVFAVVLGWIPKGIFVLNHAVLLASASLSTAAIASFILASLTIAVIFGSRACNVNPDNVATPIAAALGDLVTLIILACMASLVWHLHAAVAVTGTVVMFVALALTPIWFWLAHRNPNTRTVLANGWSPIIASMLISSASGLILNVTVVRFHGIAVFQPVINGVGGNLVAVQASRLSTYLHGCGKPLGKLPPGAALCTSPIEILCSSDVQGRAVRALLALVIPGHLIFMYIIHFLEAGHTSITPMFVFAYLLVAFLQVLFLLCMGHCMVHGMWKRKVDPDNAAIPYLTALGDLLGTLMLAVAFQVLFLLGDRDADVGD